MDHKLQRWVQRNGWNRAVAAYDTYWQGPLRPAHEAVLAAAALRAGEAVIDVASGTGLVTLPAAHAVGPTGSVLATDLAPGMLDALTRHAAEQRLTNVEVRTCDAADLGAVGPFDVALCALGLMYVPDPETAMAELVRVVRPGGRLVVTVWGERRRCGWAGVFPIVDARVSSDVCPLFFALGQPGALAALVGRAGFERLREARLTTELVYRDADAAIGAAFVGGPVALAHARFDAATRASAHAEYLASIEPFRDGTGYRVPGEFVTVTARRPDPGPRAAGTSHISLHHHQPPHHQGALP